MSRSPPFIQVLSISGTCLLEVDLRPDLELLDLRKKISKAHRIPVYQQRLQVDLEPLTEEAFDILRDAGTSITISLVVVPYVTSHKLSTALLKSCRRGRSMHVDEILQQQIDPNSLDARGNTALHLAALFGHAQVVTVLCDASASLDMLCLLHGRTALHKAPCYEAAFALCQAQADVNKRSEESLTPLNFASQHGRDGVVAALLVARADLNTRDGDGASAIFFACQEGHVTVARALCRARAAIDTPLPSGSTPLYVATSQGHADIVQMLCERCASTGVSVKGTTPFARALERILERPYAIGDRTPLAEILIEARSDVNHTVDGVSLLQLVCGRFSKISSPRSSITAVISMLCKARAHVNFVAKDGSTPLSVAAELGHARVLGLLCKYKANADVCAGGESVLHKAVLRVFPGGGSPHSLFSALLEARANVNMINSQGSSPLSLACKIGASSWASCLCEARAAVDVNTPTERGRSALFEAAKNNLSQVVSQLCAMHANPDVRIAGDTPLLACLKHADETGRIGTFPEEIAKHLLQAQASANCTDSNGQTALCLAADRGFYFTVQVLCEARACVNAADFHGTTPLLAVLKHPHFRWFTCGFEKIPDVFLPRGSDTLRLLLEASASVNAADAAGRTAMFVAATAGLPVQVLRMLCEARACVNTPSTEGITPLLAAARQSDSWRHSKVVRYLCEHRADPAISTVGARASGVQDVNAMPADTSCASKRHRTS